MTDYQQGIAPGTMVPFITGGIDTCKAELLGLTRDGEQVVLMIEYYEIDQDTGKQVLIRRIFQRDRREIEGLTRDAKQAGHTVRLLRGDTDK